MPWRHVTYVMWWHIVMSHVMSSWYFVVQVKKQFMFYSVFHNSRAFKCVDANFLFSQKKTSLCHVMTSSRRGHRKSSPAPFRAENIFRKSHKRNFGCWSSSPSNRQKCALGVISPFPLVRGRVNIQHAIFQQINEYKLSRVYLYKDNTTNRPSC